MVIGIKIDVDSSEVIKNLDAAVKKKIPGAINDAINRTAFTTRNVVNEKTQVYFDRPNPFTRRAAAVSRSYVKTLKAWVYIQPKQASYLMLQVFGGTTNRRKVVPARSWPTNAYGNLRRGTTKLKNVYKSKWKGMDSYWKLKGGGANRHLDLIGFIPLVRRYTVRFPFDVLCKKIVMINLPNKIKSEIDKRL